MTVAAVMMFSTADGALADTAGRPAVRRMVESAWAGGATPIVVVAADDEAGRVAAALAGSPAILAEPAPPDQGAVGQIVHGIRVATGQVTETDAALIWPGRMAWVDAETVTSLIERHGAARSALLRPCYGDEPGWPVLLPIAALADFAALSADLMPDLLVNHFAARVDSVLVDTGDPGTVLDRSTPIEALPEYAGPPEPARPAPEWGAAAADVSDDVPLEGPALAPYGQATDETA